MDSENTSANNVNENIDFFEQNLPSMLIESDDIINEMTERAKTRAVKQIKGLLRRPEHLEKVFRLSGTIFCVFLFINSYCIVT